METTIQGGCGGCTMRANGCGSSAKKLSVFDWLSNLPEPIDSSDFIEVQFKNTRKGYFHNASKLDIFKGDMVAVESSPGHDIGEVTLTGKLVLLQMKKNNIDMEKFELKKVYRKVRDADMEKYNEAKSKEHETMIKSRQIAEKMVLNMKIGDVEYQGDGNKAIFYYIADERVDFRQLIKVFAETFHVRIEMKQIGARQEAGRIGGIGPCGQELCCSKWMTNFNTVTTNSARQQDISLNPQKLAGQCGKLKCCLNFEVDTYVDAQKDFPSKDIELHTKDGIYYHFKSDIFGGIFTYSTDKNYPVNLASIPVERVKEIISMNKRGMTPSKLELMEEKSEKTNQTNYENVVGQDSVTRFDKKKGEHSKSKRRKSKDKRGSGNEKL